jgi:sialate O-acetylesterase
MRPPLLLRVASFGLLLASSVRAAVSLAAPFTSHMVLQRGVPIPVFGSASPAEIVTVTFAGESASTPTAADGHWRLDLPALPASAEGRPLTVAGSRSALPLTLDDVLVGEVWLASGQSNMDFTVSKKVKYFAGVANEEAEIAAADHPLIRMFTGAPVRALEPQSALAGQWLICSPQTVPAFSAVAYLFARDLQTQLGVPVGILTLAYGASTAEAWIGRPALLADPQLKPMVDRFDARVQAFRAQPPAAAAEQRSEDVNAPAPKKKAGPRDPVQDQHNPTVLFNGMIAPVIPYAIRGVIWYQGESIVGGAAGRALYPKVQATLVTDWRRLWAQGDFPFYIVQLAGQDAASNSPWIREAQATILQLPGTGMAVAADIGEAKNVHPKNKQDVADRLARIALAQAYGKAVEYSGPVYQAMTVEGPAIRLHFTHVAGGLVARGGPLRWFSLAGADHVFVPAEAEIVGDSVRVSAQGVTAPVAVRYAWANFPDGCNLFNQAGLPAAPFRTDTWDPPP